LLAIVTFQGWKVPSNSFERGCWEWGDD